MKITELDRRLAMEAMTDDERKKLSEVEHQLADAQAKVYRPLLQVGVERVDGKDYSKCQCGWLEPHGSTRCGNAAHWGNVQHAWEDKIAEVSTRADKLETALRELLRVSDLGGRHLRPRDLIDLARARTDAAMLLYPEAPADSVVVASSPHMSEGAENYARNRCPLKDSDGSQCWCVLGHADVCVMQPPPSPPAKASTGCSLAETAAGVAIHPVERVEIINPTKPPTRSR